MNRSPRRYAEVRARHDEALEEGRPEVGVARSAGELAIGLGCAPLPTYSPNALAVRMPLAELTTMVIPAAAFDQAGPVPVAIFGTLNAGQSRREPRRPARHVMRSQVEPPRRGDGDHDDHDRARAQSLTYRLDQAQDQEQRQAEAKRQFVLTSALRRNTSISGPQQAGRLQREDRSAA